jgi:threonine synthase
VLEGLAPDSGLFMPERIPLIPPEQVHSFRQKSFAEISQEIAIALFGEDLRETEIADITRTAINFDTPVTRLEKDIYALELFHGPTLAFKDVGARFMARMLGHFTVGLDREVNVLVATSGDTGSAVASGFWNVEGIRVYILYPSGGVSELQEKQLTTLGGNITALEIAGTFDDCQRMAKQAFRDPALTGKLILTSANSINLARLLPQSFYYFNAWARLPEEKEFFISVPSGNFGNLTAGLVAGRMGLPVRHFIVATNINDVVPEYLRTGVYRPRPSIQTIANAMDVGNPSNFARIMDLFDNSYDRISRAMTAFTYTDGQLREAIGDVHARCGYIMDPHGAAGYLALKEFGIVNGLIPGVFCETAHPGKFSDTVGQVIGSKVEIPDRLKKSSEAEKVSTLLSAEFEQFREFLLSR